jgi:antitoxin (DNA-binding transcriptional repressor) of toxin-antitoxin stability system
MEGLATAWLPNRSTMAAPEVRIMVTVNLDDAKARLPEIISGLNPGEQVVIVKNGEPIAMLTRSEPTRWPCAAGSAKDTRHWMGPDFDAPLDDFREYME